LKYYRNRKEDRKELYAYQQGDIDAILSASTTAKQHHLLYQLPTGGGKTVIFSDCSPLFVQTRFESGGFNTPY
jgi:superfamily II DNA or RNA helicase